MLPVAWTALQVGNGHNDEFTLGERYTTWYGKHETNRRRVCWLREATVPISGRASMTLMGATTASKNSPPRPHRFVSYQRTASLNSSEAGSLIRRGTVTSPESHALSGASRPPTARASLSRLRSPPPVARFRLSMWPRHQDPPVHQDLPAARPRVLRVNRGRGAVLQPTRLWWTSSWASSYYLEIC